MLQLRTFIERLRVATTFSDLIFNPSITELVQNTPQGATTVLTGINNSGKSAYLKHIADHSGKLYIGVNRFYSFHHLSFYNNDPNEMNNIYHHMQNAKNQAFQ